MRRNKEGNFKGSLFVEFKTKESADKLLGVDELRWKDSLISAESKSVLEVWLRLMVNSLVWQ